MLELDYIEEKSRVLYERFVNQPGAAALFVADFAFGGLSLAEHANCGDRWPCGHRASEITDATPCAHCLCDLIFDTLALDIDTGKRDEYEFQNFKLRRSRIR